MRTKITLVGALAALVLTGCGAVDATNPASRGPNVSVGQPTTVHDPSAAASPAQPASDPVLSTSSGSALEQPDEGWFDDAYDRGDPKRGTWVAAWFVPGDGFPDLAVRYWRVVELGPDPTAEALLASSVGQLDEPPPDGMSTAFGAGLEVLGVTMVDRQVVLDLAASSPGLRGHASHGTILGELQLRSAAAHYFPEADTLCVTYDGVPTDVEAGGATFLHDASGCPLALRSGG